jgi:hypothetical protein
VFALCLRENKRQTKKLAGKGCLLCAICRIHNKKFSGKSMDGRDEGKCTSGKKGFSPGW